MGTAPSPIWQVEKLSPKVTHLQSVWLRFEIIQSVSRDCIPDHLVTKNKAEVYFYQMILSPYLEGFSISKFLSQFASADMYFMLV